MGSPAAISGRFNSDSGEGNSATTKSPLKRSVSLPAAGAVARSSELHPWHWTGKQKLCGAVLDDEMLELRERVEKQKEEIEALRVELENEREAAAMGTDETLVMISRLEQQKGALQLEAAQYKRMAEETIGYEKGELVALQAQVAARDEEIRFLTIQLHKSRDVEDSVLDDVAGGDEMAGLRAMASKREEKIQLLKIELDNEREAAAAEVDGLMEMISKLEEEMSASQLEAAQAKRVMETMKMSGHEATDKISALQSELLSRDLDLQRLIAQLGTYQSCLQSHGIDPDTGTRKMSDISDLRDEIHTQKDEIESLRQSLRNERETKQRDVSELSELRDMRRNQEKEIELLKIEIEKFRQTIEKREEEIQSLKSDLKTAMETMQTMMRLQQEKAAFQMEASKYKRIAEEKNTVAGLRSEIAKRDAHITLYRSRLVARGIDPEGGDDKQAMAVAAPAGENTLKVAEVEAMKERMRRAVVALMRERAMLVMVRGVAQKVFKAADRRREKGTVLLAEKLASMPSLRWLSSLLFRIREASQTSRKYGAIFSFVLGMSTSVIGLALLSSMSARAIRISKYQRATR